MRDRLGFAFFLFAGLLACLAAWQHATMLAWLAALHNLLLAAIYARRKAEVSYDRPGLWLGLIAAFLPMPRFPDALTPAMTALGMAGYVLVLWSLLTLGNRFGIAPADRGLVTGGPYRLVRHPMYLGELLLRLALLASVDAPVAEKALLLAAMTGIQIIRSLREERVISGYQNYSHKVRWRLLPGVF